MATTTYTVTHPDGTQSTRKSTRPYTHAVVVIKPRAARLAIAQQYAETTRAYAARGVRTAEDVARADAAVAAVLTGPEVTYAVHTWSGREDLAMKAEAKARKDWATRQGMDLQVVALDTKAGDR